jgi:hypothetical protein
LDLESAKPDFALRGKTGRFSTGLSSSAPAALRAQPQVPGKPKNFHA